MSGLTLVINLGSSSLKAALLESNGGSLWRGEQNLAAGEELETALESWMAPALEPHRNSIARIGHRVVHGGERFTATTRIDAEVEQVLHQLIPLAPLHNPAALIGIHWARQWTRGLAPEPSQWACFDTGFHSTLPEAARTYALAEQLRQKGFRRFGFHGLNHQHVSETVMEQWCQQGREPSQLRLISAHLGAGASLSAICGGRCIDTTMGYTPMEGLVMATRSGSVDPGLLLELMREGLTTSEITAQLQQSGGLKGLSGLSGDMREIRAQVLAGHSGAQLALAVFRHRLLQGIGAMAASLGGVDVLALSGGIGEHDQALQTELKQMLDWIPALDLQVIPADEEGMIARLCQRAEADFAEDQPRSSSGDVDAALI